MTTQTKNAQRVTQAQPAAPGIPHPDPVLAAKGWHANHLGVWVRKQPEIEREVG